MHDFKSFNCFCKCLFDYTYFGILSVQVLTLRYFTLSLNSLLKLNTRKKKLTLYKNKHINYMYIKIVKRCRFYNF